MQELADFALTRYYQPSEDYGLGPPWRRVSKLSPEAAAALLGDPIGPPGKLFDPGRMGSYFQAPERVRESLAALAGVTHEELEYYRRLLEECVAGQLGVYVTF